MVENVCRNADLDGDDGEEDGDDGEEQHGVEDRAEGAEERVEDDVELRSRVINTILIIF